MGLVYHPFVHLVTMLRMVFNSTKFDYFETNILNNQNKIKQWSISSDDFCNRMHFLTNGNNDKRRKTPKNDGIDELHCDHCFISVLKITWASQQR